MAACEMTDNRKGKNTQHSITALLRQSVYSRLAGYEDTNDAERLSVDPAMRHVIGERANDKTAASASQMGRFETETFPAATCLDVIYRDGPPIVAGHFFLGSPTREPD